MFSNAEAYERFMGRWSRVLAPPFIQFAGVPNHGQVLDVGSGTGALAFDISRRRSRARIVGIDPSDEYVAFAVARNPDRERISFRKGDAQRLDFATGAFTAGLSMLVFNFIPDPEKAIRELRRVVEPKGCVSAAVWDYGGGMRMLRAFWDAAVRTDARAEKLDEKHMKLCRAGELSALWRKAGMHDVHEQPLEVETTFPSFADYWEPFLLGQGPAGAFVRTLDTTGLEDLRNAVKRELSVTAETKPFTLPARAWAVRGTVPA